MNFDKQAVATAFLKDLVGGLVLTVKGDEAAPVVLPVSFIHKSNDQALDNEYAASLFEAVVETLMEHRKAYRLRHTATSRPE